VLRAAGGDGDAGDDVQLADIQPVGAYGVQFVFSDGHDRGMFPWVFLRELLTASAAAERTRSSKRATQLCGDALATKLNT
jgi:DUF971 family protein